MDPVLSSAANIPLPVATIRMAMSCRLSDMNISFVFEPQYQSGNSRELGSKLLN